mmetsp:Transcript_591/g.1901  ORF Transcript_591/g.1901 Transcript_591/m.1901 type:complete len:220 (+) Transcript_591:1991-2650(+)
MGMDATRRTTLNASTSQKFTPIVTRYKNTIAQMIAPTATSRTMISRRTFSKCPSSSTPWTRSAVFPKNVCDPVAITVASISPRVTVLPIFASDPVDIVTGSDSPVSAAWSTWIGFPWRSVQSAGTAPPAPRQMTSPGTSVVASQLYVRPPRFTHASGFSESLSAAIASPAFISSKNPTNTFRSCRTRSTNTSIQLSALLLMNACIVSMRMAAQIMSGIG